MTKLYRVSEGNQNDGHYWADQIIADDMEEAVRKVKDQIRPKYRDHIEENVGDDKVIFLDLPYGPGFHVNYCDCPALDDDNDEEFDCEHCTAVVKWIKIEEVE